MKENYEKLLASGMFWERKIPQEVFLTDCPEDRILFHPELTGEWEKDKEVWEAMENKRNKVVDLPKDLNAFPLTSDECYLPIESAKNKFFQQVSDYLNAKYKGGIHYDSERSLFEIYDRHENRTEIENYLEERRMPKD